MLSLLGLLAALDPFNPELPGGEPSKVFGFAVREMLLILGVVMVLALVLFLWVYLTRKQRPGLERSPHRAIHRAEEPAESSSGRVKVRKRRRRHPENMPRNPTLGETGGLPPLRSEEPSEPTQ